MPNTTQHASSAGAAKRHGFLKVSANRSSVNCLPKNHIFRLPNPKAAKAYAFSRWVGSRRNRIANVNHSNTYCRVWVIPSFRLSPTIPPSRNPLYPWAGSTTTWVPPRGFPIIDHYGANRFFRLSHPKTNLGGIQTHKGFSTGAGVPQTSEGRQKLEF